MFDSISFLYWVEVEFVFELWKKIKILKKGFYSSEFRIQTILEILLYKIFMVFLWNKVVTGKTNYKMLLLHNTT